MRVTKIIREYVEKTVGSLPKFKEHTPEEKEYEAMTEKVNTFVNNLDKEVDDYVNKKIAEFRANENIPEDIELINSHYTAIRKEYYGSQMRRAADRAREARVKAKNQAIEEILVSLELGGTRADLDNMIKALSE
jgi:Holliday junction resolvase RusA-like endonuclease